MFVAAILIGFIVILVIHDFMGKPFPFLRWSYIRMVLGMRRLLTEGQVGDGREEETAKYVIENAPADDIDAAIRAIDEYAYRHKFLINVGDEKGEILAAVIRRERPRRVLELGAYIGYSALRIARHLPPGGHLYSVEFSEANAAIARRIIAHAGVTDRVTIVVGSLGDGGRTLQRLGEEHGFTAGSLDVVFIDHDKRAYLPDLQTIIQSGWLHPGSVVVADNVGFPGAPEYRKYMDGEDGKRWRTRSHATYVEYQSVLKDVVLESTLIT